MYVCMCVCMHVYTYVCMMLLLIMMMQRGRRDNDDGYTSNMQKLSQVRCAVGNYLYEPSLYLLLLLDPLQTESFRWFDTYLPKAQAHLSPWPLFNSCVYLQTDQWLPWLHYRYCIGRRILVIHDNQRSWLLFVFDLLGLSGVWSHGETIFLQNENSLAFSCIQLLWYRYRIFY